MLNRYIILALSFIVSGEVIADNITVKQAKAAGVKSCLYAVEKIANFAIEDGSAGTYSHWATTNPDKSGFSSIIERNFSDGTIVTNIVVVPDAKGGCYTEYTKMYNSGKSCLATSQQLDDAKYKGEINKEVGIFERGSLMFYMIPNGTQNCTVVSKEVMMEGPSRK